MNKRDLLSYFIALVVIFCFANLPILINNFIKNTRNEKIGLIKFQDIVIEHKYKINPDEIIKLKKVRLTYYQNHINQTDDTPNITASNRIVYEGSCAISRDLLKKVRFGDIIFIKKLNKFYIVEDLMNARFKNSIDIFSYEKIKIPKYSDVYIIRVNK